MDTDGRWMGRSDEVTTDYRMVRNRGNRYLQDRQSMKIWSYNGLGRNFLPHDTCATEGAGPIQDRTQEHLGTTDKGIIAARKFMLRAIQDVQEGRDPPTVLRDPNVRPIDSLVVRSDVVLPASIDWHNYWQDEALRPALTVTPG